MADARYIQVILPLKLEWEPYYRLPEGIDVQVGDRVRVRFAGAFYVACVSENNAIPSLDVKRILPVEAKEEGLPPISAEEIRFWRAVASYYLCNIGEVYKAAYPSVHQHKSRLAIPPSEPPKESIPLTEAQQKRADAIKKAFADKKTVLMSGAVGQADIELSLALETLAKGQSVLLLIPEARPELEKRIKKICPSLLVYHSGVSAARKKQVAEKLRTGDPCLVLGTRVSLFLPYHKLGLVIVDDEHDSFYKQDAPAPRYHARESAIMLACVHDANVLLASATPSLESIYNAQCGRFAEVKSGGEKSSSPRIELINIAAEIRKNGMAGLFSLKLLAAMREALQEGKEILLLGSRRIYEQGKRMEDEVLEYFPEARIANLDLGQPDDEYEIYLGSILGTKSFRTGKLGLVAIISYDGILSRQDFRADEKAFQVLSQYRNLSPRFVVQTREAGHPVFRLMAKDVNPVEQMLTERSIAGYPPYSRLVRLQLKDTNANRLSMMSRDLAAIVANIGVRFEGPYTPVQDAESREIRVILPRDRELVKRKAAMAQAITAFEQDRKYSGHIVIDVDPV
jgi:primosomal protein N'